MKIAAQWFTHKNWKAYAFQKQCWKAIAENKSGLLNAPTGCGKTFAVWFGVLQNYFSGKPPNKKDRKTPALHCLWITPLRALSKEILLATQEVSNTLQLDYKIALRTGDTTVAERNRQKKKSPQALITTPESVHLMLASKDYEAYFASLEFVVVDEWHELMGSKRGVQIELALSRLKAVNPALKIWGISATIGNLEQARDILTGGKTENVTTVRAEIHKDFHIETVFPDSVESYSWVGHLGIKLLPKVIPIIEQSKSTLVFVNVRSQAEIWYRELLEAAPHLAGTIAVHHGSLSNNVRKWVEDKLHEGELKAVVCTASLDLGVDFQPVDTVIQVGSAKGIARFMQRAGRSGHHPGALSKIFFVPTNSLEIIEGAALKFAVTHAMVEQRIPYIRSFDVLIQYLVTLAVSDGFNVEQVFKEVKSTHCFNSITEEEFQWCVSFITTGGASLGSYNEYHKVVFQDGLYKVIDRAIAMRHRLSIGTIVSDSMMHVKYMGGKNLGVIEEWFISRLKPGDVFWYAGKNLELVLVKDMEVRVRRTKGNQGIVPAFMGGRLPLSSQLSRSIRKQLNDYLHGEKVYDELEKLAPLLELQRKVSHLPANDELLIEQFKTRQGYHTFIYPFEGRFVHEGMAAILAHRIGALEPVTFSIAMNDYGFELLSDRAIDMQQVLDNNLFTPDYLYDDALRSMNATEMAKRRFRDIATIAGLVFTGYPGKQKKTKHLQASSQLFFKVFEDYEKDNLLFRQAYDETLDFQLEINRMQDAFTRISGHKVVITHPQKPTPFSFPILVDSLREHFSNEDMQTRIEKILKSVKDS